MVIRKGVAARIRGEQAKIAFSPSTTVRSVGVSVTVGGGGGGGGDTPIHLCVYSSSSFHRDKIYLCGMMSINDVSTTL